MRRLRHSRGRGPLQQLHAAALHWAPPRVRLPTSRAGLSSLTGRWRLAELTLASLAGNVFSYLFLVMMGRRLSSGEFGEFVGLFGGFVMIAALGSSAQAIVARDYASTAALHGDPTARAVGSRQVARMSLVAAVPALAAAITTMLVVGSVGSLALFALLFVSMWLNFVLVGSLGLLQGQERFRAVAFLGYLVPQMAKFALALPLILIWPSVEIAFLGVLVGTAITAGGALAIARPTLRASARAGVTVTRARNLLFVAAIPAMVLVFPTNADVLLVNRFFTAEQSGQYAAAATLGKIVLFAPVAVPLIFVPRVAAARAREERTSTFLLLGLAATLVLAGLASALIVVAPGTVLRIAFGARYLDAERVVQVYSLAMLFASLNVAAVYYALATRQVWPVRVAVAGVLSMVLGIALHHERPVDPAGVLLLGNIVTLPILIALLRSRMNGHRHRDD